MVASTMAFAQNQVTYPSEEAFDARNGPTDLSLWLNYIAEEQLRKVRSFSFYQLVEQAENSQI